MGMGRLKELQQVKKQKIDEVEESHICDLEEALRILVAKKQGLCICMPEYDIRKLLPLMAYDSDMVQYDMLCLIFPDGEICTARWKGIYKLFKEKAHTVDNLSLRKRSLPLSEKSAGMLEQIYERLVKDEFVTKEDIFALLTSQ